MKTRLLLASFALTPFLAMVGCADKGTHRTEDNAVKTAQGQTLVKPAQLTESGKTNASSVTGNPPSAPLIVNSDKDSATSTPGNAVEAVTANATNNKQDELFPTIDISEPQTEKPQTLVFQFKFNKHELSNESKAILLQHAEYLGKHKDMVLKVIGHTDSHGPKVYNEFLSRERALSVANMLIEYGANPGQIQIIGKGDAEPLNDVANYAENRRVELDYLQLKSADASDNIGSSEVNLTSSH